MEAETHVTPPVGSPALVVDDSEDEDLRREGRGGTRRSVLRISRLLRERRTKERALRTPQIGMAEPNATARM